MIDSAQAWIAALELEPNPEGGHFRGYVTRADPSGGTRPLMTVIYYLLSAEAPLARLHRSSATAIHYHHAGGVLEIHSVDADGRHASRSLASPGVARAAPQVVVEGGAWKGIELVEGPYALISEAVVPGWIPEDHESATAAALAQLGDATLALKRFVAQPPGAAAAGAPRAASAPPFDGSALVDALDLTAHVEGGFFRETWGASSTVQTAAGARPLANTIYYLLTEASPLGVLHRNVSDITHFFHSGGPIRYAMIDPAGRWHEVVMGRDVAAGQVLAFTCPGGWWKSSRLAVGSDHGLISEIVAPGFDYADQTLATAAGMGALCPGSAERWRPLLPAAERGR
ncbi:MAG: cupin domain-containing protein [Myxococcales bacterium]|nr:cupin domain-containing protein [Myxococcales bacterium]